MCWGEGLSLVTPRHCCECRGGAQEEIKVALYRKASLS
jgi:hypothetical protein